MTPKKPLRLVLLAAFSVPTFAPAQAPHTLSAAEHEKVASLVQKMTLEQKLAYVGGTGFAVRAVPELGLPAFEMSDGPFGTRSNAGFPSTTYAAGIGLAATWDRALAERVGAGIGRDARARGVHFMLGPGVNIYKSPRNGRNFEYFGEDPFLTSAIAVGYITGMQSQGVSATIKHFLANNSEYLRHDSDSVVDERTLRELYLPAFEAGVKKAHVGAIMDSYNLINGVHATQNGYFNTAIVRKEWGFPGVMMSDWVATYDGVAAANGGLDIEMPTGKWMSPETLSAAIKSGKVSKATIDEKITRILSTAMSFGWLDRPQLDPAVSVVDRTSQAAALDSARESAVLLKNTGNLLPLDRSRLKTILVVGPNAYPGTPVGGGSAGVVPFHLVSAVEGLTKVAGAGVTVLYDRGLPSFADLALDTAFTTTDAKPGITVETFANDTLTGTPRVGILAHVNTKGVTIDTINADPELMQAVLLGPSAAAPPKSSRRWTGTYTAAAEGEYLVIVEGSGEGSGNRLLLEGKQIVDNWSLVRAFQPSLQLHLAAGPHKIILEDKQDGIFGGHIGLAIVPAGTVISPRAVQMAAKADAVIVCAGYDHASEGEAGDRTFSLPFGQDQLIAAMAAANPKTVVSVTSGGNVDSTAWLDKVPALLESWYSGQEGGTALAELTFGDTNPSGHLPATFERRIEDNPTTANYYPEGDSIHVTYKEGLFVGYRGYLKANTKPLFPFGYGLSYTTFSFAKLALSPVGKDPVVTVTFDVTNTGQRAGAEVAQVYVADGHAKVARPARELKGFERVQLAPGETKHVSVQLDARAFAFYDVAGKRWSIAPGKFTVLVGDSVESLPLKGTVDLTKQTAKSAFLR